MRTNEALLLVIDAALKSKPSSMLRYAAAYATKALGMPEGSEGRHAQLLYVRSNLDYWRGPVAKQVKDTIDTELS